MFFVLFGTRPVVTETSVSQFVCHHCGIEGPHRVWKRSTRFTLFFIPIFSFGTKHAVTCGNCGATTELTAFQARNSSKWADNRGADRA